MNPNEFLLFTESHEWIRAAGERVVVGITDYAVEQLGRKIVAVELRPAGLSCARNAPYGFVESAKASFDLIAPITGVVTRINSAVLRSPGLVGDDPYGAGWLAEMEPANREEFARLLDAGQYEALTR